MTTSREQRRVFGEVAEAYDDVRAGYPTGILDLITGYAGRTPGSVVESGAGTGKGTALLRGLGVPLTCVEPDPAMAALLARRFDGDDLVSIVVSRFEDWTPPSGGVELLASAQAWHWVDHTRRTRLAADVLAPGGVLALFGHDYGFADQELYAEMNAVYLAHAPEIADQPDRPVNTRHPGGFHPDELRDSSWFADVEEHEVVTVLPYDTARYLTLLSTFSPHRMLPEEQRVRLHRALGDLVDARGGVVEQKLTTGLCLARRQTA
jgi:SAM-dependent methyltransferase